MQTPPSWLQIYSVAKLCRQSHFSREVTVALMSWIALPLNVTVDYSKPPCFFAHYRVDGSRVWDDMLIVRKRTQSSLYIHICSNFKHLLCLYEYEVGYKKAVECPW